MKPVTSAENEQFRLSIYADEDAMNPRTEFDNLGTMVCWHRRYDVGDKHSYDEPADFSHEWNERNAIILPVYMYDHSSVALSTRSFVGRAHHAEWDSGQVGYVYVSLNDVRQEYHAKRVTRQIREQVIQLLEVEVKTYSQYVSGDVYGFQVERISHCGECGDEHTEVVDSCWGFYGNDWKSNGMSDYLSEYADLLASLN